LKYAPPSWHSIVQQGYLNGLAATEKEAVIDILLEYSKAGKPDELRRLVPGLLAKLGKRYKKKHPEIKSKLEKLLEDRSYRVRIMALIATKSYEDSSLIPTLRKIAETEARASYVRYAREAIRALSKKKEPKELDSMKKSIEELEKENRDLKDKVSKIESMLEENRKNKMNG
jgi:cell division protein FtsB